MKQARILIPVIISGGHGTRLWPVSTKHHPKPFIALSDGESFIQKTYQRATQLASVHHVITVTNASLLFYTAAEYQSLPIADTYQNHFILEPEGRDSAAAIAMAAQYVHDTFGPNAVILVMPADHLIESESSFCQSVELAYQMAMKQHLVTFGIKPTSPHTGFGYIQHQGYQVNAFLEKPNQEKAKALIQQGDCLWNAGIFCMNASDFLSELGCIDLDLYQQIQKAWQDAKVSILLGSKIVELTDTFKQVKAISVDYAVFEKSDKVAVVPCDMGWKDVGSWQDMGALYSADANHNQIKGQVKLKASENCTCYLDDGFLAGVGLKNLIVVVNQGAVLVADKSHADEIKTLVSQLSEQEKSYAEKKFKAYRPWGNYQVLQSGQGFKVKKIAVKVGGALSLQSHQHRSEHWVVVHGQAEVTKGDTQFILKENESTYISMNEKHRLKNVGQDTLVLVEVQCGEYLGEDDIIRFEDIYGRKKATSEQLR